MSVPKDLRNCSPRPRLGIGGRLPVAVSQSRTLQSYALDMHFEELCSIVLADYTVSNGDQALTSSLQRTDFETRAGTKCR